MLVGRTRRAREEDVASRPTAGQAARIGGNFGWALAYALAAGRDNWRRIGLGSCVGLDYRGCLDLDHRGGRLDGRCLGRRLGQRGSLPRTLATASGLLSALFLALGRGP